MQQLKYMYYNIGLCLIKLIIIELKTRKWE